MRLGPQGTRPEGASIAGRFVVAVILVMVGAAACSSSSKSATHISTAPTIVRPPNSSRPTGFCGLFAMDQTAFNGAQSAVTTPAQLKKLYDNLGAALDEARDVAPSAIKRDMDTFVTALTTFLNELAAANYDSRKLAPTALVVLETPTLKDASAHIDQYMQRIGCSVRV